MGTFKMEALLKKNDGVFIAERAIVRLGAAELEFVKQQAQTSPRHRARICAHKEPEDPLHEMFIALSEKGYIRPHKHQHKSESFHVLEGEANVVIFNDSGEITEVIQMGSLGSPKAVFYRLPAGHYHTVLLVSPIVVLHEVTNGPFQTDETIQAPFAPPETERDLAREYIKSLTSRVAAKTN